MLDQEKYSVYKMGEKSFLRLKSGFLIRCNKKSDVSASIWWRRRELNPRPQTLRPRYYMCVVLIVLIFGALIRKVTKDETDKI
jgi:hypothetical protein